MKNNSLMQRAAREAESKRGKFKGKSLDDFGGESASLKGTIFNIAKNYAGKIPLKWKFVIGGILYIVISGIGINIYWIVKLF